MFGVGWSVKKTGLSVIGCGIAVCSLMGAFSTQSTFAQAQPKRVLRAIDVMERKEMSDGTVLFLNDELHLGSDDVLVLDEPAVIHTNKMDLDEGAQIDTQGNDLDIFVEGPVESDGGMIDVSFDRVVDNSGQDGQDGTNGVKALDALRGSAGAHGQEGTAATNGGDGADVSLITPELKGNLKLITRGGNGGRGGAGGDGGNGGRGFGGMDARTLFYFRGLDNLPIDTLIGLGTSIGVPYVGQVLAILSIFNGLRIGDGFDGFDGGAGGNGGRGGVGGDGGNAGNIDVYFGTQAVGSKILVNARGGRAGTGGLGGRAGVGGEGGEGGERGDIWAREGKPGKSGAVGGTGEPGKPGKPGKSGRVEVTETGDPEWIKCYVRYRRILQVHEDKELARDVLKACI